MFHMVFVSNEKHSEAHFVPCFKHVAYIFPNLVFTGKNLD